MALIDNELVFGTGKSLTAAGTSDVIDCGQDILTTGLNDPDLKVVIVPTTPVAGTASVTFELQDCDTSGGTFATIATTGVLAMAGKEEPIVLSIPLKHRRYLTLKVSLGSGTNTAGAYNAYITKSFDARIDYESEDYTTQ